MSGSRQGLLEQIEGLLSLVSGQSLSIREMTEHAIEVAPWLLRLCELETQHQDRAQSALLSRLMNDPRGQIFTTLLTDRAHRSHTPRRTVEQAQYLLREVGAPGYVGAFDKWAIQALGSVGGWLPGVTASAMLGRIRRESGAFILSDGPELDEYLTEARIEGVDVNVNHLGEEVLGEAEAERRVVGYIALIERPGIETMSVKALSICSQLDALSFERSVATLTERLGRIFRAAWAEQKKTGRPKLVVLDMEAYRDVELTVEAFKRVLSEPSLLGLSAGIALQTYLPETLDVCGQLLEWVRRRVARGGAPIRVRLVKGANLAMERVEASLHGFRLPILPTKLDVDANFKRVLLLAARDAQAGSLKLGLASHNLFDVAFGLVVRSSERLHDGLSFELLHGMANPLLRSLRLLGAPVLVYAPVVGEHEFPSAIAYLVRRLDENTSADNYLRHSFGMRLDSQAWKSQTEQFRVACARIEMPVPMSPGRAEDRRYPDAIYQTESAPRESFYNETDTDFSAAGNREWITQHLEACRARSEERQYFARSRIAGQWLASGEHFDGFDPSRPGFVPYRGLLAGAEDLERALATGTSATQRPLPLAERRAWLEAGAEALRRGRGELLALMVLDAGKRVSEGDGEVSEAIDFARYYAQTAAESFERAARSGILLSPRGLTVVTPPWNFPLAIPLGGVFAAIAAGNPVILKPSLETPLVATRACELLWEAGFDPAWLQLVVCDDERGSTLIRDERVATVVLTGGTSTARKFLEMRPDLHLLAETGGKNALCVSDMSDREQAVIDIVKSAFGHAGQKCSALSQLVLHREVYEDRGFREMLIDATTSLEVGSAWEFSSVVTPLISPPSPLQTQALTVVEAGESWLVRPQFSEDNPRLVSPGIKWGVATGSRAHTTEFFCPLLSVLVAEDLEAAVRIANSTSYGLTAGLHSLDEREHDYFVHHMQAGNLYINRPITGAIVRRQPFGGWKSSSFGPGAKAGGPNYVAQFVRASVASGEPRIAATTSLVGQSAAHEVEVEVAASRVRQRQEAFLARVAPLQTQEQRSSLEGRARTLAEVYERQFAAPEDVSQVHGEENLLRYRALRQLVIWVNREVSGAELGELELVAVTCECPTKYFVSQGSVPESWRGVLGAALEGGEHGALIRHLETGAAERICSVGPVPDALRAAAHRLGVNITSAQGPALGAFSLLMCLREQAVCTRYHRYGHLGLRQLGRN